MSEMNTRTITITGGSGFVGRLLREGLGQRGYSIRVYDRWRGLLVDCLRRRYLGRRQGRVAHGVANYLRRGMRLTERLSIRAGILRESGDDILEPRSRLVERFRGSRAVIHLEALPHPFVPGMTAADFRRINYEGSINVFEAACEAGVPRFVFASSGQVYGINNPVKVEQFPILETNYSPTLAEGQTHYGLLKREFECYLENACRGSRRTQAVSFRLEYPGTRSLTPRNFYISTSFENLVAGFEAAIERELSTGSEVFNLADRHVDEGVADIQAFLKSRWPDVPNYTSGNECLLSTAKVSTVLGYDPRPGGTYFWESVMW